MAANGAGLVAKACVLTVIVTILLPTFSNAQFDNPGIDLETRSSKSSKKSSGKILKSFKKYSQKPDSSHADSNSILDNKGTSSPVVTTKNPLLSNTSLSLPAYNLTALRNQSVQDNATSNTSDSAYQFINSTQAAPLYQASVDHTNSSTLSALIANSSLKLHGSTLSNVQNNATAINATLLSYNIQKNFSVAGGLVNESSTSSVWPQNSSLLTSDAVTRLSTGTDNVAAGGLSAHPSANLASLPLGAKKTMLPVSNQGQQTAPLASYASPSAQRVDEQSSIPSVVAGEGNEIRNTSSYLGNSTKSNSTKVDTSPSQSLSTSVSSLISALFGGNKESQEEAVTTHTTVNKSPDKGLKSFISTSKSTTSVNNKNSNASANITKGTPSVFNTFKPSTNKTLPAGAQGKFTSVTARTRVTIKNKQNQTTKTMTTMRITTTTTATQKATTSTPILSASSTKTVVRPSGPPIKPMLKKDDKSPKPASTGQSAGQNPGAGPSGVDLPGASPGQSGPAQTAGQPSGSFIPGQLSGGSLPGQSPGQPSLVPGQGQPSVGSQPGQGQPSIGSQLGQGQMSGVSQPGQGQPSVGSQLSQGLMSGVSQPGQGQISGGSQPGQGQINGGSQPGQGQMSGGSQPGQGQMSGGSLQGQSPGQPSGALLPGQGQQGAGPLPIGNPSQSGGNPLIGQNAGQTTGISSQDQPSGSSLANQNLGSSQIGNQPIGGVQNPAQSFGGFNGQKPLDNLSGQSGSTYPGQGAGQLSNSLQGQSPGQFAGKPFGQLDTGVAEQTNNAGQPGQGQSVLDMTTARPAAVVFGDQKSDLSGPEAGVPPNSQGQWQSADQNAGVGQGQTDTPMSSGPGASSQVEGNDDSYDANNDHEDDHGDSETYDQTAGGRMNNGGFGQAGLTGVKPRLEVEDFESQGSGHFMAYFLTTVVMVVVLYVVFHNKQKIIGFIVEGRNTNERRRRPSSGEYKRLTTNVEEGLPTVDEKSPSQSVIY